MGCVYNGWTDRNDLYIRMCVLPVELPFWGCDDCTCIKIFSGIIFLIAINCVRCQGINDDF